MVFPSSCSYCGFSCSSCRRWVHSPYPLACSPQYRRASKAAKQWLTAYSPSSLNGGRWVVPSSIPYFCEGVWKLPFSQQFPRFPLASWWRPFFRGVSVKLHSFLASFHGGVLSCLAALFSRFLLFCCRPLSHFLPTTGTWPWPCY